MHTCSTTIFGEVPKVINAEQDDDNGGIKMRGWICPVCGRGVSPYTNVCPCKPFPQPKVTC